jgi:hypothetical protein
MTVGKSYEPSAMLADMGKWKSNAPRWSLALQKVLLRPFDVVVTDFHMPK